MNLKQAKKFLADNQVRYVLAQFVDIHGVAKTKSVPVSHFEDILGAGAGFAGFAVWGLGMEPHSPDFLAVGDLDTLSLVPWQPGYARIVCDGRVLGKPYPFDTRFVLKQQVAAAIAKGWTLNVGIEPEFMLLERRTDGSLVPADAGDTLDKPCYDYKGLSRSREMLERLVESLQTVGFDVYQIDHEDANGQFEINYTYSDALNAADRYVFFRMAAGEIANEMGLICTFMPKPFRDRAGSGMHMHLSLADAAGTNLFHDAKDKQGLGLSKIAYHFLGGHRPISAMAITTEPPWCASPTVGWSAGCPIPAATPIWRRRRLWLRGWMGSPANLTPARLRISTSTRSALPSWPNVGSPCCRKIWVRRWMRWLPTRCSRKVWGLV